MKSCKMADGLKCGLFVIFALICLPAFSNCNVRGIEPDAPVLCGNATQGGFLLAESDWQIDECRAGQNTCNFYKNDADRIFIRPIGMDETGDITVRFCKDKKCQKFNYKIKQRKYMVQKVGVDDRFVEYPPEISKRINEENIRIAAVRDRGDNSFADFIDWKYPFARKYPTSGSYGARRIFNGVPKAPHKGWDIAAPKGTPVHPISGGRVVLTLDAYLSGKTVIVSHGHLMFSIYAHLEKINVKNGDIIGTDSVIGMVGATGRASGPHLHLGLYFNQTPLDPELLF